jgi:putative addiction module component (TIGR02574 family)
MSVSEIIETIRPLPAKEKQEILERLWTEFGDELEPYDPDLTPEQLAELDRRAEEALKHPERGRPAEEVFAEIEQRLRAKK